MSVVAVDGGAPLPVIGFDADEQPDTVAWAGGGRSLVVAGKTDPLGPNSRPFVTVVDVATGGRSDLPLPGEWDDSGFVNMLSTGTDRFLVMRAGSRGWAPPEWLDLQGRVTPLGDLRYAPTSNISLSPDSKQLLYVTYDPARPEQGQALVAVPLDGGEPTRYSPWTPSGFGDNYSTFTWQPG